MSYGTVDPLAVPVPGKAGESLDRGDIVLEACSVGGRQAAKAGARQILEEQGSVPRVAGDVGVEFVPAIQDVHRRVL